MAKFTNRKKQRLNLNVDEIDFTIQEDRFLGLCKIKYNRYTEEESKEGIVCQFKLLSCWMDNQNGNATKAYMEVNMNNPMHANLVRDIKGTKGRAGVGLVSCRNGYCLSTDGKLIRYGMKPGGSLTTSGNEHNDYEKLTYFDSKAQALEAILNDISRHRTIGGLNLVSLNRLPDNVLIESGFEKVDDLMRTHNPRTKCDVPRGISMWLGSPSKAVGGGSDYRDREGAAKSRQQFLDLLNKMLQ